MSSYQYASPQWRAAMREILTYLVAEHGHEFPNADFSVCEIISGVPPDGGRVILGAHIVGDSVTFLDEEYDADVVVRGDYEAMLPAAKLHYSHATPDEIAAQAAHSKAMAKAGRVSVKGEMAKAPKALLRVLSQMHNRLAEITA